MPDLKIEITSSDSASPDIEKVTAQTIELSEAMATLLEKEQQQAELEQAKAALSQMSEEEKQAALAAHQLSAAQEEANQQVRETGPAAGGILGTLGELKTSWIEVYGAIGTVKEVIQAGEMVVDATIGKYTDLAMKTRELKDTIGATAEEASTLIAVGDDLQISADSIQRAMEAAIRKGVDPNIEGLARLSQQYQAIQDPVERTRFLMENFGRTGNELTRLMRLSREELVGMGEDARKAGQVLTETDIKMAEQYVAAKDRQENATNSLNMAVSEKALPAWTSVTTALARYIEEINEGKHQYDMSIQGIAGRVGWLIGEELQANKTAAAEKSLTTAIEKQTQALTNRGSAIKGTYYAPGSEGYNPSGYVWTEPRAGGGPVSAGMPYLVNENKPWEGPEWFVPDVDGFIVPGGSARAGAPAGQVVLLQPVYAPQMSLASQAEMEAAMLPMLQQALHTLGIKV